eukprot:5074306-Amphidinium_carterae.1
MASWDKEKFKNKIAQEILKDLKVAKRLVNNGHAAPVSPRIGKNVRHAARVARSTTPRNRYLWRPPMEA